MFKFDPVGPDPNVAQWGRGFVSALFCTVLVVCGPETVSTCKLEFDVVGSQKQCTGSFYMLVVSSDDKLNLEFDVLNLVFLCVNGHDTRYVIVVPPKRQVWYISDISNKPAVRLLKKRK